MNNSDLSRYSRRLVQYFWDPMPTNTDPTPIWCLGEQYASHPGTSNTDAEPRSEVDPGQEQEQRQGQEQGNGRRRRSSVEREKERRRRSSVERAEDEALQKDWPADFLDDIESRIWLTYRSNFDTIPRSPHDGAHTDGGGGGLSAFTRLKQLGNTTGGFTSDTGWGCMIRSGQSLLANALAILELGRDWRTGQDIEAEKKILSHFADDPSAAFSIHRFVEHGAAACAWPSPVAFSMADEGRNTERHHHDWSPGFKLRDRAVQFVSSGTLKPSIDQDGSDEDGDDAIDEDCDDVENEDGDDDENEDSDDGEIENKGDGVREVDADFQRHSVTTAAHSTISEPAPKLIVTPAKITDPSPMINGEFDFPAFVIDTTGDRNRKMMESSHPQRPPPKHIASPARSDSSNDEVIVFKGRSCVTIVDESMPRPPKPASEPHVTDTLMDILEAEKPPPAQNPAGIDDRHATEDADPMAAAADETTRARCGDEDSTSRQLTIPTRSKPVSKREKANRRREAQRSAMEAEEDAILQDYIDNMDDRDDSATPSASNGWLTEDTTSDGEVVLEATNTDSSDDEALDSISIDATSSIDIDGDGDDSDLERMLDILERERWDDDDNLRRHQQAAMSDEQIARILEKQEELGIDADDLLLFDDSGFGDVEAARLGLTHLGQAEKKKLLGRKFPESAVEDYADFDVMDYDRPSLRQRNRKNRKSGKPELGLEGLSDEELVAELEGSWAADRRKKRVRKAEREELRAQGLLGRKAGGKADLAQRYREGMNMADVKEELRDFLVSGHASRAMPPMAKHERKVLHQIAQAFQLTSKSRGQGKARFTVLAKTQRTLEWSDRTWKAASRNERAFLANPKAPRSSAGRPRKSGGGGYGAAAGTTYRHGEVVGASAPEISASNFGHRLMQKMGWEKGTALGKAVEGADQRILVPVQATIKSGRGGLG